MESFSGGRTPTSVSTKKRFRIHKAVTDSGEDCKLIRLLWSERAWPERSGSHLEA